MQDPGSLDVLFAQVNVGDRLVLIKLCDEYLLSVVARNSLLRAMWAHPDSWSAERRDGANEPSSAMMVLRAVLEAEFARVFGADANEARKQVLAFMLGRFDV